MMGYSRWSAHCRRLASHFNGIIMKNELQRVVDALPGMVWTATPDSSVDYVNEAWCAYTGLTPVGAVHGGWQKVIHPDDHIHFISWWHETTSEDVQRELRARLRGVDGRYRLFSLRANPLRDTEGNVEKWCGLCYDIHDADNSEAKLGLDPLSIINCIPAMVAFMTPDGVLEVANQKNLDYIGASFRERKEWEGSDLIHPEDLEEMIELWTISLTTGTPFNMEHRIRVASGEYRWIESRALPVIDRDGKTLRWCVLQVEIEEQKRDKALIAKALADVRSSEYRLRNLINAVPGFVWSAASNGYVTFLNNRWYEYTGMPISEASSGGWRRLLHPDDVQGLGAYIQDRLRTGTPGEYEARLRRHDGMYRWFLIRGVPHEDENGALCWYGENTDIEDRKRAEMLIAGENRLLELMAHGTPLPRVLEALCELVEETIDDSLCNIVLVDLKSLEPREDALTRLKLGAAPNTPIELMSVADGRVLSSSACPRALSATANERVISSDLERETRWTIWQSTMLLHGLKANWSLPILVNGEVAGVLSISRRIIGEPSETQQKLIAQLTHLASIAIDTARNEAALKQSQAFMTRAQRLSATGTFSWSVDTNEVSWTDEIPRILGLDPGVRPTFNALYMLVHPDDTAILKEAFRRHRQEGRDFEHQYRLLLPDGELKHVHLVAHAIRNDDDSLEYIAVVQDVTQRRQSEEALDKVRSELAHLARVATLGALTASIAHEVNQPLAGIITNASTCMRMLSAESPNIDSAKETVRRTLRDGTRAADVIKRLRALFSKNSITIEPVDLNGAAQEVISMLLNELQRSGVLLHPSFFDHLPYIQGDRVQLQQVIQNLILNAIEAMGDVTNRPKQIWVSTDLDSSGNVCLAVRDDGSGFDSQDAERLFNAFYTTKNSGMGIGLSVSRSIIEKHEGRLWATTNDQSAGATFQFSIPQHLERSHDASINDEVAPSKESGASQTL